MKLILSLVFFSFLVNIQYASSQAFVIENVPTAAYLKDGKWSVIDSEGDILFESKNILEFGGFSEGLFHVKIKKDGFNRWVYMNANGETVIEPDCDKLTGFKDGTAIIIKNLKIKEFENVFAFIDTSGEMITSYRFIDAYPFSEELAWARSLDTLGYIDKSGNYKLTLNNLVGYPFSEGLAPVNNSEYKMGFIDTTGKVKVELKYDQVGQFSEGLAYVHYNGKLGYIDKNGDFAIKPMFHDGKAFNDGRAFYGFFNEDKKMKWGVIDRNGDPVMPVMFDYARDFSEGLAAVAMNQAWGFIDTEGFFINEPMYSSAGSFKYGMAWASVKDRHYGFIDRGGAYILEIPKPEAVYDLRMNLRVY